MEFILGLHGVVALMLFCSLVFAEEAGVPLPLPGEVLLVAGGVLVATGGLDAWLFVPLAYASALGGAVVGYSWARLAGERGLRTLAERLGQARRMHRATQHLRQASARDIALSRLLPGLRVYTTLVAGAAGIERARFLAGVVPATAVWLAAYTVIGVIAGVPAERLLGRLEGLILQGAVLIVIGAAAYVAVRRVPEGGREVLSRLPLNLRMAFALLVDMGLIASVVAGVLAVVRPLSPTGAVAGWVDILVVIAVIAVFYSLATRRGSRPTAGETLFGAAYITAPAGVRSRHRLRTLLDRLAGDTSAPPSSLLRETARFRALADRHQLTLVHLLLLGDYSAEELGRHLNQPASEIIRQLRELQEVGLIAEVTDSGESRYMIRDEHLRAGLSALLDHDDTTE